MKISDAIDGTLKSQFIYWAQLSIFHLKTETDSSL
jgi:hypothetical protein